VTASSQPTLRDRRRAELRERIIAAALTLFAERGFDQVTVEEIAAATGISLSTLFRHVPAKDDLLVAVVRTGRAVIVANFGQRPAGEPAREALAQAILLRTEQFTGEAETIELWRRAMASAPARIRRAALLDEAERGQLIGLVAARRPAGGEAGPDDLAAGVLVQVMLAAAEYAYEHWLAGRSALTLHELTRRALVLAAGSQDGPGR
jgi:AcrR family transcriptional regulator